jgi:hypothetical protein
MLSKFFDYFACLLSMKRCIADAKLKRENCARTPGLKSSDLAARIVLLAFNWAGASTPEIDVSRLESKYST